MLEVRKPPPLSNYDRSLVKSHDAHKKRKRASGKDVPQLEQQKQPMQNLVVANEYGFNIEVYRPDNSGEVSVQALNVFSRYWFNLGSIDGQSSNPEPGS